MSLSGREIAQAILDNIGGPDNVRGLKNCSTRLCFTLKNASMVREENIKRLSNIVGIIEADNLYYIIPEAGFNLRIYNELAQILGIRPLEKQEGTIRNEKNGLFSRMWDALRRK